MCMCMCVCGPAVDLNAVLSRWKGGGHPAAAAASIKLRMPEESEGEAKEGRAGPADAEAVSAEEEEADEPPACGSALSEVREIMEQAITMVVEQIPEQVRASDLMTKTIWSVRPEDSMDHVLGLMNRLRKRALPVLGEEGELMGFIKYSDPVKAARSGKGAQLVKAWMRRYARRLDARAAPSTPRQPYQPYQAHQTTKRSISPKKAAPKQPQSSPKAAPKQPSPAQSSAAQPRSPTSGGAASGSPATLA